MKKILMLLTSTLSLAVHADNLNQTQTESIQTGVTQAMYDSVQCWNAADLKCFMAGYVKSDKTLFISGDKFIHGWQNSYDHYQKKYSTNRQGMGKLNIKIDEIRALDENHAFLYGRWQLKTESKEYSGVTSLIFEKHANKWQIIVDHSN
jgi:hypothetical protein